jgi:hypothetical protein
LLPAFFAAVLLTGAGEPKGANSRAVRWSPPSRSEWVGRLQWPVVRLEDAVFVWFDGNGQAKIVWLIGTGCGFDKKDFLLHYSTDPVTGRTVLSGDDLRGTVRPVGKRLELELSSPRWRVTIPLERIE